VITFSDRVRAYKFAEATMVRLFGKNWRNKQ